MTETSDRSNIDDTGGFNFDLSSNSCFQLIAGMIPLLPIDTTIERDILREIEGYNEHKIPASIEDARMHAECTKFGFMKEVIDYKSIKICPCCCNIEAIPIDPITSTEELDFSGPVIPLFFELTKFLIVLCLLYSAAGIIGQYYIIKENCRSDILPKFCGFNLTTLIDTLQRDKIKSYYDNTILVMPVLLLVTIILYFRFHKRSIKLKEKIDKGMITASDYTVMMYDIAPENESLEYIQNYIRLLLYSNGAPPVEIVKINIGKFEGNFHRIDDEIVYVKGTITSLRAHKSANLKILTENLKQGIDKKIESLMDRLKELEEKKKKYIKILEGNASLKNNSIAFITLRTQNQASVVSDFDSNFRFLKWILSKICSCLRTKNSKHYIQQAPEPDDVNWKFIGYSPFHRFKSIIFSVLITSFVLLFSFGLQIGIRIIQKKQIDHFIDSERFWTGSLIIQVIQFASSLLVSLLNMIIVTIALKMSRYEKHLSHSMFTLSHTRKLIVLQFINTVGIVIGLTYVPAHLGGITSFSQTVFINMLTNLVLNPLLHAFDPSHLARLLKQYTVKKKMEKDKDFSEMTQKELNELFEPADLTIYLRYTSVIRTFFVSCFFFDILPLGMPICFFFLLLQFWTDKNMVIRRYKRSIRYHHQLSYKLNEFTEISMFLLVSGNALFKYKVANTITVIDVICVVVSFIFIVYPTVEMAKRTVHNELVINEYHDNTLYTGTARNTYYRLTIQNNTRTECRLDTRRTNE